MPANMRAFALRGAGRGVNVRQQMPTDSKNIENNPMQSSLTVAGGDALADPAKTF
jgi:hypothetical protein